jgi:putative chitinase
VTSITAAQMRLFASRCDYLVMGPALAAAAAEFQITTPARICAWLGQLFVESAGFTRLDEDLNYSAARILAEWPHRFASEAAAAPFAHAPQALAERVYGGRFGNVAPGDGWKYRGGGLIQTTFHDNYAAGGKRIGVDLVAHPEQLRTPAIAALAAGAFWADHGLNALADRGDIAGVTHIITGADTALAQRKLATQRAGTIWR